MPKWSYLVIESYQDVMVDENGDPMKGEDGEPLYMDVWTDGENEYEGDLTEVLNGLGSEGWEAVSVTGDEFVSAVVLKREL